MKKVIVLLSSYNGEKYISEQLDSLLAQTWQNTEIHVRDDGSSDRTPQILREYAEKHPQIHVELATNVGCNRSFFLLTKHAPDADYYAFCDQDDVWMPQKLRTAVERLDKEDADKPQLLVSNYDFYDAEMHFQAHGAPPDQEKKITFEKVLLESCCLGFTEVFNKAARDSAFLGLDEQFPFGHDLWLSVICRGLGNVIYESQPLVRYRRHTKTVSGASSNSFKLFLWRVKYFLLQNDSLTNLKYAYRKFEELWGEQLCEEDQKLLALLTKEKYNLGTVCKKMFHTHRYRFKLSDELAVRTFFLLGKL